MRRYMVTKAAAVGAALAAALVFGSLVPAAEPGGPVTAAQAIAIALAQTDQGEVVELRKRPSRSGGASFHLEIVDNAGPVHVEVDAATGTLLQLNRKHDGGGHSAATTPAGGVAIEQAREIALTRTGGGNVRKSETEVKKSGAVIYEFDIVKDRVKYEVEIDAATGEVRKFEIDK